ncbi:uncharacterized protein BYT42DRAFT_611012 [Radiomyces spectabilis]|uniref:uncharacterized protein n=1 Tax=Radiomyces spectabilis TaxID=64574 RepID=UPI00221ECCD5|nr:uncharacterized protein BYT42DRAFT_611012 [Radiomyces spectabilis]KAI8391829.1 hypothetical protein BYT42DRAFT_611012 [Radiomyces spectabilis]
MVNRTTLENLKYQKWTDEVKKDESHAEQPCPNFTRDGKNVFHKNIWSNWCEVMGNQPLYWFLPIAAPFYRDGIHFVHNETILAQYLQESHI